MAIDLTALTLSELRYAVALADHRHFGRAAQACAVSQPTLSAQVKKLERTLGTRVFERTSHKVELTPIGEAVVEQARRVLEETERILGIVHSQAEPLSGPHHQQVGAQAGDLVLHRTRGAVAERDHRDDRADADHDAEDREERAQEVPPDLAQRQLQGVPPHLRHLLAAPCRRRPGRRRSAPRGARRPPCRARASPSAR